MGQAFQKYILFKVTGGKKHTRRIVCSPHHVQEAETGTK